MAGEVRSWSAMTVAHSGKPCSPSPVYTSGGTQQAIFFNDSDGVVLGEGGDTNEVVTLWRTDDGGTQWTSVLPQTN